jgi:hypothetical protein
MALLSGDVPTRATDDEHSESARPFPGAFADSNST